MSGIVKALEWETDQVGGGMKAGEYRVRAGVWTHGYYWTKGDNEARTGFEDEEAAQCAATADFEQYILSCLDPSYPSSQAEIERLGAALVKARERLMNMTISAGGAAQNKELGLREIDAALSGSKE